MLKNRRPAKIRGIELAACSPNFTAIAMQISISSESLLLFWQIAFVLACVLQLFYFVFVYVKLAWYKLPEPSQNHEPVSVVIAARNEYDNLLSNLPAILEQDYPKYEVIVVNDGSWDDTASVLQEYKSRYKHLHVVNVLESEKYDGFKKYAVTLGIKAAKFSRVLLTDADCRPASRRWIRSMVEAATDEDRIVLGYSPYTKKPGALNKLIRFDSMFTAMNYLGFAMAGVPYMGVGRNLSYPKARFFEIGGFRDHYKLQSGDDDLLVNQIAGRHNTAVCINLDALVETEPEETFKNYWWQKRRHLTTGRRYRFGHKLMLLLQPLSLLLLFVASLWLLLHTIWVYGVISAIVVRLLAQIIIFKRSSRWLGHKDLVFLAPFFEIVLIFLTASVHIANASSKNTKWKT